jgi:hypothetical protein
LEKAAAAPPPTPQRIGEELFLGLFSGQVGALWARSLGVTPERGLRLQLRLDLAKGSSNPSFLHELPWELLYQPETRDFLALSRLTPVVRYLEVARPTGTIRLPCLLRILVVIADSPFPPPLDLARERREIEEAWAGSPAVEVTILERARAEALRETLLASPFHVLHFMGHGRLDRAGGEGLLYFAGNGDALNPVPAESLATLLKDFKTLRLVFLNACDTARAPGGQGFDPYAGIATALVMAGIPAVVAMQLPISDLAAIAFSRAVHLRLAAGDPVDAAVTEGRQAIYTASPGTLEWAVPVLFTRVADGRLFELQMRRSEDAERGTSAEPPPTTNQRRLLKFFSRALLFLAGTILLTLSVKVSLQTALDLDLPGMQRPAGSVVRPALDRVPVGRLSAGRYEVSQSDFRRFVLANPRWRRDEIPGALHDGDYLRNWISWHDVPVGLANHPVTHVSWYAARAFCEWLGGRLPTRQEWQQIAHTAEGRFPWGATGLRSGVPPPLNYCDAACQMPHRDARHEDGYPETAPVDAFPRGQTKEGVFNLSGNVWEWCADASGAKRLTLGGSYLATFEECSTDQPIWEDARLCAPDGGFRCVWE